MWVLRGVLVKAKDRREYHVKTDVILSQEDWLPLAAANFELKSLILAQIERWRHA